MSASRRFPERLIQKYRLKRHEKPPSDTDFATYTKKNGRRRKPDIFIDKKCEDCAPSMTKNDIFAISFRKVYF